MLLVSEGELWLVGGTIAGVLVAVSAVVINSWLQRSHFRHVSDNDKKNLQLRGLTIVFEKMSDPEKRKARKNLLYAYALYLKKNRLPMTYNPENFKNQLYDIDLSDNCNKLKQDLQVVKSDLEQIAIMQRHGLIDEETYFDAYWGSMLRCYPALFGHINKTRKQSGIAHFTVYYPDQCDRAIEYWRTKHHDSLIEYYVDPDFEKSDWQ